jgi:hypothetical protein
LQASQDELREYFAHFGQVKDARIITDPRGNSKGYGFVTYESEQDASKVLSLKEEDLVFKESKLNIGHAFRKKNANDMSGPRGMNQPGGHMGNSGNANANSYNGNAFGGMGAAGGFGGLQNGGLNGMGNAMMGQGMSQLGMSSQSNGYLDLQLNGMHSMAANGAGGMNGYGQSAGMNLPSLNGHLAGMNMNGMNMSGLNGMNGLNGLGNMNGMNGGHMGHLHGMNGLNSISPLNGINMN